MLPISREAVLCLQTVPTLSSATYSSKTVGSKWLNIGLLLALNVSASMARFRKLWGALRKTYVVADAKVPMSDN